MTATPWLSVVMPVFNGAATLPAALASLEGQTDGIEIIAVDQASRDESRAILEEAATRLPLRVLDNPQGTGWCRNTNLALSRARAPLVAMLHQDDVWRPGRAALLQRMARDMPDVDLWIHGAHLIDRGGRTVGHMSPPFGAIPRTVPASEALSSLLVQNTVALPATMIRTAAALSGGGLDETLWYTADWDLWLRLARRGVGWHPERAAAFRIHRGSLTLTGSRDAEGFRAQLAEPVARHIGQLAAPDAERVRRLAEASNAVNAALAGAYHAGGRGLLGALSKVLALGPHRWPAFVRATQLPSRVWPRLRLALGKT